MTPCGYIYGIDPGTTQSALIVWSPEKLSYIYDTNDVIRKTVRTFTEGHLFIEMMNFQGRFGLGQESLTTCAWIGRFYEAAQVSVTMILRRDVPLFWCGSNRAKDSDIAQAVRDRIGGKGNKRQPGPTHGVASHGWQALAVAAMGMELLYGGRLKLEESEMRQYNGRK